MRIVLTGQVPAKKNSRRPFIRNGRIMNFPSTRYVSWEKDVLMQLKQWSGQPDKKATITYQFYVKDNRPRDIDNMIASINDALVKAGLLRSDSWQELAIGAADAVIDRENPRVELWLEEDA